MTKWEFYDVLGTVESNNKCVCDLIRAVMEAVFESNPPEVTGFGAQYTSLMAVAFDIAHKNGKILEALGKTYNEGQKTPEVKQTA